VKPIDQKEIDLRFKYHPPTTEHDLAFYRGFRSRLNNIASIIVTHTAPSREQALALTKLEEVVFWTNAARARHGDPFADEREE
jgi:hypothetical protein